MTQDRRQLIAALSVLPFLGGAVQAADPIRVRIETPAGAITVEVYPDRAPITVANFLRYVDEKRFKEFYRTVRPDYAPTVGLIQGGCHGDPARLLPPIAHESTAVTGLRHKDGTLSMPRRDLGTADGEFFICVGDASWFDVNPIKPGDNQGYAAFGQVVDGMAVVHAIHEMPTSPTEGADYGMAGQILEPPLPITAAQRV